MPTDEQTNIAKQEFQQAKNAFEKKSSQLQEQFKQEFERIKQEYENRFITEKQKCEKEFERIMSTILTTSDHQWSEIVSNFRPFVMNWDFGNTKLAETLSNLGFTIESDPRIRSQIALSTVK